MITSYTAQTGRNKGKIVYMVCAEALNKYTLERVQKKRRNVPTLPKAERIYRELWLECREEKPDSPRIQRWGELVDEFLSDVQRRVRSEEFPDGFSPGTIVNKRCRLSHVNSWKNLHLELITPRFVREKLDQLERDGTCSRQLTAYIQKEIKTVFTFAIEVGALQFNPLAGLKQRKVPGKDKNCLTIEEANKLLLEAKRRNHPFYPIWLLSLTLGLRRSELAGIKWSDVNLDQGLLTVHQQKLPNEQIVNRTKGKRTRVVPIPKMLFPVLKQMKLKCGDEFVINVDEAEWINGNQAAVLRGFCREIGIREIKHHDLRATYITQSLVDNIPLGVIKESVGHSKLSTTDIYVRSSGMMMKGKMDSLSFKVPSEREGKVVPMVGRK